MESKEKLWLEDDEAEVFPGVDIYKEDSFSYTLQEKGAYVTKNIRDWLISLEYYVSKTEKSVSDTI